MKILFIHQSLVSFVEKDMKILRSAHEIRELRFRGVGDIPTLFLTFFWADVTFSWFGKLHAFFAALFCKMFGKKAVVVAGGDDVVYEPEINYGMFVYWWKKWCPLFVFRYADLILSVSEFNHRETLINTGANPAKIKMIYHGFDAQKFRTVVDVRKELLVITVGGVDWERLHRKGYKRFVKSAAYMPEVQFALIGKWYDDAIDYLRELASDNVIFTNYVTDDSLLEWFSRAKVYVQASVHEGFGCSVAEAMLCECIPVVTRKAALPEVVGDCGLYLDELNPRAIAGQIEKALSLDWGKLARDRIVREFSIERRREALLAAVSQV